MPGEPLLDAWSIPDDLWDGIATFIPEHPSLSSCHAALRHPETLNRSRASATLSRSASSPDRGLETAWCAHEPETVAPASAGSRQSSDHAAAPHPETMNRGPASAMVSVDLALDLGRLSLGASSPQSSVARTSPQTLNCRPRPLGSTPGSVIGAGVHVRYQGTSLFQVWRMDLGTGHRRGLANRPQPLNQTNPNEIVHVEDGMYPFHVMLPPPI